MIVVAWDAIRAGLATQQTQYRGALVHAPSLSARTCPHALVVHTRPRAHPSTCTPAHHTHTTHQHHHTKHAIMQTHQHQLAHTHHQTSTGARADTRPHGHAHSHTGKGRRTCRPKTCSWRRVAGKPARSAALPAASKSRRHRLREERRPPLGGRVTHRQR